MGRCALDAHGDRQRERAGRVETKNRKRRNRRRRRARIQPLPENADLADRMFRQRRVFVGVRNLQQLPYEKDEAEEDETESRVAPHPAGSACRPPEFRAGR